jgi:hypothetical protein
MLLATMPLVQTQRVGYQIGSKWVKVIAAMMVVNIAISTGSRQAAQQMIVRRVAKYMVSSALGLLLG